MRRGNVLRRHRRPLATVIAVLALGLVNAADASAQASFSAHGSAEQVYLTGLSPNARMSLLRANGTTAVHAARGLTALTNRAAAN